MYKVIMMFLVVCLIFANTFAKDNELSREQRIQNCIDDIVDFFKLNLNPEGEGEEDEVQEKDDLTRETCFEKGLYNLKFDLELDRKGNSYYNFYGRAWTPGSMLPKTQFCKKIGEKSTSRLQHETGEESTSQPLLETGEASTSYSPILPEYEYNDLNYLPSYLIYLPSEAYRVKPETEKKCLTDLKNFPDSPAEALYYVFYKITLQELQISNNQYGPLYMNHALEHVELLSDILHPYRYCAQNLTDTDDTWSDSEEEDKIHNYELYDEDWAENVLPEAFRRL